MVEKKNNPQFIDKGTFWDVYDNSWGGSLGTISYNGIWNEYLFDVAESDIKLFTLKDLTKIRKFIKNLNITLLPRKTE